MRARLADLRDHLAYVSATLRLIWAAAGRYTAFWAVLLLIEGLLPAIQLFLIRPLVDSLTAALGGGAGWENVQPVVFYAALMAGTIVLTLALQSAIGWLRAAQAELTRDHLTTMVQEKATAVDFEFYENPEYHDLLDRARSDLRERPLTLLESIGQVASGGVTLVAMAAVLLRYGPWLPILVLVSTLPVLYVVLRHNLRYHEWWTRTTVDRRRAQYYDYVLTSDSAAAEVRLFGLGPHFQRRYRETRERLRREHLRLTRQQNTARLGAGMGTLTVTGAAMAWMVWRGFQGLVTLGDIALLFQALNKGQSLMGSLMGNLGRVYSSTLFLSNLFDFLALEPKIVGPPRPRVVPAPPREGIRFRGVSFSYPGSDRPVLQGFDFHIPAGQIVALVGSNGAGKTTLMKLLCRFYDPDEGVIELDGVDLRSFEPSDLRRRITGLFQFPVPYLATAAENIEIGDLGAAHRPAEIESAARRAGAHDLITGLPRGYDTLLGKWFPGGAQVSGGEWQRLALARSFLRDAPIMILDEPTSHLDSWSEIDWFDRFRELAHGRTALLITHRFLTARYADVIHVMDRGQILESGTHEQLVALDGLYASSWRRQMSEASAA